MLRIHCKNTSGGSLHLRNGIHSLLNSYVLPEHFYSGNMEDAVKYRHTLFVSLLCLLFWSLVASNPFKAFKKTIKSKLSFCLNFSFLSKLLASQERIPLVAVKTNKPVAWVRTYTYSCNAWIFLLQWMLAFWNVCYASNIVTHFSAHFTEQAGTEGAGCVLYDASQLGDYSVLYFKLQCWKDFRLYHVR